MNRLNRILFLVSCAALLLVSVSIAHADTVTGTVYCDIASSTGVGQQGTNYAIQTPTLGAQLANAIATSAGQCANFTTNSINFASGGDLGNAGTSLNSFLTSGGPLLTLSFSDVGVLANGGPLVLANGAQDAGGALLVLTGTNYLADGGTVTLSHDDGALIYVCAISTVCDANSGWGYWLVSPPGSGTQTVAGQSPFTFTGLSGYYNFVLIYNSNYEQPSELVSNINMTPEPSGLALLGTGVLGLAGVVRRRIAA